MTAPWPFAQWGLDIMGPFPTAVRQLKFLVVGIDYFTKWVEVEALATITEKNVRSFVWRCIICRFGIPRVFVSDNGRQFDNDPFRDFCSQLGIKNHCSSPEHPQANGQDDDKNTYRRDTVSTDVRRRSQDSARGVKGYMAQRIAKYTMGIQDDGKNTHRRDTVPTDVRRRSSHPGRSWTHKLQGAQP
ncbi:uncharacterized protein K02A2.6-like [Quercus lobata]|uniref:uncharacterized protein K02A2.6-like n=1 Tax=Quercus lobata TaxID=97700 RepID=UPI001248977C|nr:uncharacterized protein K02A2.6-like [Quercus lobata]